MTQETPLGYFNKLEKKEAKDNKELSEKDWLKSIAYSLAVIAEKKLK